MSDLNLHVIKLDLDRKWTLCAWTRWCDRVVQVLDILSDDNRVSKVKVRATVKGYHVFLTMQRPAGSGLNLVIFQALLGSDGVREALNLRRVVDGRKDDWNILFLQKGDRLPNKSRMDLGMVLVRALRSAGHPAIIEIDS